MDEHYHLERFVEAQSTTYEAALSILRSGHMCVQYMDFIFPRLVGCYHDKEPAIFAISQMDEARAYLAHRVLGPRLRESLSALMWLTDKSAVEVFGEADVAKLHSSLTLFGLAADEPMLRDMLSLWFNCRAEEATIAHLDLTP